MRGGSAGMWRWRRRCDFGIISNDGTHSFDTPTGYSLESWEQYASGTWFQSEGETIPGDQREPHRTTSIRLLELPRADVTEGEGGGEGAPVNGTTSNKGSQAMYKQVDKDTATPSQTRGSPAAPGTQTSNAPAGPSVSWSDKVAVKNPFNGAAVTGDQEAITEDDITFAEGITDAQIREAFAELKWHQPSKPRQNPLRIPLDMEIARRTFGLLSKAGVMLFTAEEAPSRDRVIRWAEDTLINHMGFTVRMIRCIAQKHFLIVVGDADQREFLLKNAPGRMEGKMIQVSMWNPSYNYQEAAMTSKQIWVELPFVDPMIINHGKKMLEKLGPILYYAVVKTNEAKYSHIRACVMMRNLDCLHDSIILELPWGGEYTQEVDYTGLPDQCHKCRLRGHWAKDCPDRNGQQQDPTMNLEVGTGGGGANVPQSGVSPANNGSDQDQGNTGFTPVTRMGGARNRALSQPGQERRGQNDPSRNLSEVLEMGEDEEDPPDQQQHLDLVVGVASQQNSAQIQVERLEEAGEEEEKETSGHKPSHEDNDQCTEEVEERDETSTGEEENMDQEDECQTNKEGDEKEVTQRDQDACTEGRTNEVRRAMQQLWEEQNDTEGRNGKSQMEIGQGGGYTPKVSPDDKPLGVPVGRQGIPRYISGSTPRAATEEIHHGGHVGRTGTPRFITTPVTRQQSKTNWGQEATNVQVTPERKAVEKRRTLEDRSALLLRATHLEDRSRLRRQSNVGEGIYLENMPRTEVAVNLDILNGNVISTSEALAWIHRLDPWNAPDPNFNPPPPPPPPDHDPVGSENQNPPHEGGNEIPEEGNHEQEEVYRVPNHVEREGPAVVDA
ncbi:hypothetical protein R1sor_025560 [Riccia sorocarpa]|uniref:CCHC-type domain-containing protein n=1 Tax=Riccia sorocarpa TaxID=122646 RepID=A0ABD3GAJ0_9MARC